MVAAASASAETDGEIQRSVFQGTCSNLEAAPYSDSKRNCTTSNCNGPTAASNGTFSAASGNSKCCTTRSWSNCASPARNRLKCAGDGFRKYAKHSGVN